MWNNGWSSKNHGQIFGQWSTVNGQQSIVNGRGATGSVSRARVGLGIDVSPTG